MYHEAHIDFETASPLDIKKSGVHKQANDGRMRVWGFSYGFGDGLVYQWRPGYPDPVALLDVIRNGGKIKAHNAAFERIVWNWVIRVQYCPHWPELRVEQQDCTLARALAIGLPGKLDVLARVLALSQQKDDEGHKLMMKMARPRRVNPITNEIEWWDDPVNIERLMAYCNQDIRTEEAVDVSIPPLTPDEQALWVFDQTINDRGVRVDRRLADRANQLVDIAKKSADREMRRLTGGAVRKVSEVGKLVKWLNERGITCTSLAKGDMDELIATSRTNGDEAAEQAIELRRDASKTSVAKFGKMLLCACTDDRVRGLLQYHGASTGRWAGRLLQPQNFPRVDPDEEAWAVEFLVDLLLSDMPIQDVLYVVEAGLGTGMALKWLSKALRSCLVAAEGNKFVGGDYSNIEGRVNAWLAGEAWKLDAFRDYDSGTGPDLYKVAYSRSFGILVAAVTKAMRQIGKVQELALGYQGSVGAFVSMAANYNIKLGVIAEAVNQAVSAEQWERTRKMYASARNKCDLDEYVWTGVKIIVDNWRAAHPQITQSWWDLQDAAIEAVDHPGTVVSVLDGKVRYMSDGHYLYCALPSGRILGYASPHIHEKVEEQVKVNGRWFPLEEFEPAEVEEFRALDFEFKKRTRRNVGYMAQDAGRWVRCFMYGGLQCENIVQAIARDIMVYGMRNVEAAGYFVILTVHDEVLSEVPIAFGSAAEYERIMSILPPWARGLPLAAAAWEDKRYVK